MQIRLQHACSISSRQLQLDDAHHNIVSAAIPASLPPLGTQEHPETPQSWVWRTEGRMKRELPLSLSDAAAVETVESIDSGDTGETENIRKWSAESPF